MRMSATLYVYFARQYLMWLVSMLLALVFIIVLFDVVELMRRAAGKDGADLMAIFTMAMFRIPALTEHVLPFAVLFAAMFSFWRLTRSSELVVARAAGVSVWQFLLPAISIVLVVGAFQVTLFNPLSSLLLANFERMEARLFKGKTSLLSVSSNGVWLRQGDESGQAVIHSTRVAQDAMELHDVVIFRYAGRDRFVGRIDAAVATLKDGYWRLDDVWVSAPDLSGEHHDVYRLPTSLTLEGIQDSFGSPETMSFWDLPTFIDSLEGAGFSAHRHRLHWHSLLATPVLLSAMVLIAAAFSLRPARRGGTIYLVAAGVATGFLLYFMSDVVYALGLSASIPVGMAAWTPAGVCMLYGVSTLLHLEDG